MVAKPNTRSRFCWVWIGVVIVSATFRLNGQDTNPPVFVASVPSDGEQEVPRNVAISFTFNEPMSTNYFVDWQPALSQRSVSWSQDQRTITFLFQQPLPTNSVITWQLNPCGTTGAFRDLAGNRLKSCFYWGSFTTGTETAILSLASQGFDLQGRFRLKALGTAGRQIVFYASTNLTDWGPVATNSPSGDPVEFTDSSAVGFPTRFYKASVTSILP